MLQIQKSAFRYPEYLNSIKGLPDIYAKEHVDIVINCVDKCQKFDKKFIYVSLIKPVWVEQNNEITIHG
jgi:hypothetical protein